MKNRARRLVAIMFTDIAGYTALMQDDEEVAIKTRTRHREVFEQQHKIHAGEIIQYYGDGTLSIFKSAVEAVTCAIAIQRLLQGSSPVVPLRIGLHMGDVVLTDTEVYGDSVNVASRIENMSIPGGILISGKLNDELRNHKKISTHSLGKFQLKNISSEVEIFSITNQGISIPAISDLKGNVSQSVKSIAVLPLVNRSSSQENEYFSDGMTEEIINALSGIKGLQVTSRTSSFYFKNKQIPLAIIAEELKVSTILEGSVRVSGNRMRIQTQLIDVAGDYQFWSETFERPVNELFEVQDEISLKIADRLREHLGYFDVGEHHVTTHDVSVAVYTKYLKSRYHILKMSKSEIEKGLSLLEEVISEQPDFALAYLGIHHGYALLGTLGFLPAGEAFDTGKPYLERAVYLDRDLPECQLHLAWISFLQNWDMEATYEHLRRVYEVRPVVDYYQTTACVLIAEHKYSAASHYLESAFQLDPLSEINHHLQGFIYYVVENYEDAIVQFKKCVALKPDSQVSLMYWGQSLILLDRAEEALIYFENLPSQTDELLRAGGITLAHAALHHTDDVQSGIIFLESALQTQALERAMNLLILIHTLMGNYDAALHFIQKGIEYRLPMMVYLSVEPILKPLFGISEFQRMVKEIL
jgi:TolB-like protein/class 3 adenylate cyclase